VSQCFGSYACATVTATTTTLETTVSTVQRAPGAARELDLAIRVLGASEADEHLFEGRLTDRVVLDVVLQLGAFHRAEDSRPRQLFAGHLQDS